MSCVANDTAASFSVRFQKPLHVNELYTMKHVIDIQDYGGNRVARLLPAFRLRFDENHVLVRQLRLRSNRLIHLCISVADST